jgi:predicted translin family RNA/ssDNA-binding protein
LVCSDPAVALSLLVIQRQAKNQLELEKEKTKTISNNMTVMKKRLKAFKAAKKQPETNRHSQEVAKRYLLPMWINKL